VKILQALLALFACALLPLYATDVSLDRKKVAFFKKLSKPKIVGVKLLEKYPDPDQFYSAIPKQIDILKSALEAVEKRFVWKQNDEIFLTVMIKGGWGSDDWGAYGHQDPIKLENRQN